MLDSDETMSVEDSAALARCGVDCMKGLIDRGEIPAASFNQKHTVVLREDVIEYIRRRGREQAKLRQRALSAQAPEDAKPAGRARGPRRRPLPRLDDATGAQRGGNP